MTGKSIKRRNKSRRGGAQKKKSFKRLNCSPLGSKKKYTCYKDSALYKLCDLWNLRHSDDKITCDNPREIWNILKEKMANVCDSEKCWLNQQFAANNIDANLKHYTFAPERPVSWNKNPNEWLSSNDLTRVMKQYEKKYPNFAFIGPTPIDFDKKIEYGQCVWNELCNINIKKMLEKNKTKIGIIFNTDTHDLDGSHWICLFIDLTQKFIYYFDSNCDKISTEILTLIKRIKAQAKDLGIELEIIENKTKHQQSTSECGMYVLYIIIQLLCGGKTPACFEKRISDNEMEKLRKKYFNSSNEKQ